MCKGETQVKERSIHNEKKKEVNKMTMVCDTWLTITILFYHVQTPHVVTLSLLYRPKT
ncbi:MAG: hypothetical protein K0S71_580 [Clostridia bacterium]|nr:hypothetical protein [Clostridia bacterium]